MYEEIRDEQNNLTSIKHQSDGSIIPFDEGNRDYRKYIEWVALGNSPSPDPDTLKKVKEMKIAEFKVEALKRIQSQMSEWDSFEKVAFLASLASLLDWTKATAAQKRARDIYLFAKDTAISDIRSKTTLAEALAMDAAAYAGWPA